MVSGRQFRFMTQIPNRQIGTIRSFDVIGLPVSLVDLDQAVEHLRTWTTDSHGRYVLVRDVHGLVLAHDDETLRQIHCAADMVAPDGMPLVWLGRLSGHAIGRASGPDLLPTA